MCCRALRHCPVYKEKEEKEEEKEEQENEQCWEEGGTHSARRHCHVDKVDLRRKVDPACPAVLIHRRVPSPADAYS